VDVHCSVEVHIVLLARHQDAVSRLCIGFLFTVAVAASDYKDQQHSNNTRIDGNENNGFRVADWVVFTFAQVSVEGVSRILHADLPGGGAVSGVPVIQEGVLEFVAELNAGSNLTHDRLLVVNAGEEVVTDVQFELSFHGKVVSKSSEFINSHVDLVHFKRQRLVKSHRKFITSTILELLKVVDGDVLIVAMLFSRVCAGGTVTNVSKVNRRESSHVESLDDRSFTHAHSVLHWELEVLVRELGVCRVKEFLNANSLVIELDCDPISSCPHLFVEPGVGVVGVDNSISNVDTADRSDVIDLVILSTICLPSSAREKSVSTVCSRSSP